MNNFKEQKQKVLESGYKYVCLYQGSRKLVAWNPVNKIDQKLDEIEKRLNNEAPGIYVMKARNSTSDATPCEFLINTGVDASKIEKMQPLAEPGSAKLLENKAILDLTVQVKQLEMENDYLRKEITNLENEIAELEAAAIEAPELGEQTPAPSLMESAKDFLGSLMEFGAPLLDQHFALKQQQLEIERMKLAARRPGSTPGQKTVAKDQNVQIRIIGEWVETFADQPEIYQALHEISARSQSVAEYLELLNQFSPELYEQLSIKI